MKKTTDEAEIDRYIAECFEEHEPTEQAKEKKMRSMVVQPADRQYTACTSTDADILYPRSLVS